MARDVIIEILCDICLANDKRNPKAQETEPVTIGNSKPRIIALCDEHDAAYAMFVDMLTQHGQVADDAAVKLPPKSGGKQPGAGRPRRVEGDEASRVSCPLCEETYKNHSSRSVHMNQTHGVSINAWREQEIREGRSGRFPDEPEGGSGDQAATKVRNRLAQEALVA